MCGLCVVFVCVWEIGWQHVCHCSRTPLLWSGTADGCISNASVSMPILQLKQMLNADISCNCYLPNFGDRGSTPSSILAGKAQSVYFLLAARLKRWQCCAVGPTHLSRVRFLNMYRVACHNILFWCSFTGRFRRMILVVCSPPMCIQMKLSKVFILDPRYVFEKRRCKKKEKALTSHFCHSATQTVVLAAWFSNPFRGSCSFYPQKKEIIHWNKRHCKPHHHTMKLISYQLWVTCVSLPCSF